MGDFTMGLAQIMSGETTRIKKEPNKSVKLYTLIKDYAQRKYNADDSTVMRLYIGTKNAPEITDNGALIAYVDGKMKPEANPEPTPEPEPDEPTVKEQPERTEDAEQAQDETEQPRKSERPQQLELDLGQDDDLKPIRDCIEDAEIERFKGDKIKITVDRPDRDLELAYKMKKNGYKYKTKRGLSYFFVKL